METASANSTPTPTPVTLAQVEDLIIKQVSTAVLSWKSVPGATTYQVSRRLMSGSNWINIANTPHTSVFIHNLHAGRTYEFKVVAEA